MEGAAPTEMSSRRLIPFLVAAAFALYLILALAVSRRFPAPNPDEVVNTVSGVNLVEHHKIRYSLYDDIYPPDAVQVSDLSNTDGRPLYAAWLGLWSTFTRMSAWHARWPSVAAGFLILLSLFFVGHAMGGSALGALNVWLALACPLFWLGCCVVNELIFLYACCGFLFSWHLSKLLTTGRRHFLTGAISGLLVLVHPNALIFWIGLLVFDFFVDSEAGVRDRVFGMVTGLIAGVLLATQFVDLKRVWLYQKSMYQIFVRPPVLSWPWHPAQWLQTLTHLFLRAPSYYFQAAPTSGWRFSLWFYWVAVALAAFGACASRNSREPLSGGRRTQKALVLSIAGMVVAMMLLIKREEALYGLIIQPFVVLLLGYFLLDGSRDRVWRYLRIVCAASLVAAVVSCFVGIAASVRRAVPFETLVNEIRPWLAPGTRVAGPAVLWFDDPTPDFRDLGAVVTGRYFSREAWDLRAWLGRWRPEVLIADAPFERIYVGKDPSDDVLSERLGAACTQVQAIDTAAYGRWRIYRVRWKR